MNWLCLLYELDESASAFSHCEPIRGLRNCEKLHRRSPSEAKASELTKLAAWKSVISTLISNKHFNHKPYRYKITIHGRNKGFKFLGEVDFSVFSTAWNPNWYMNFGIEFTVNMKCNVIIFKI